MNKNKHGNRKLPPANLKPQIWADVTCDQGLGQTDNVKSLTANRSLPFAPVKCALKTIMPSPSPKGLPRDLRESIWSTLEAYSI